MAEEGAAEKHLTFNVKSSNDAKFTLIVPDTMTVAQLKEKLSTSEYANVEPSRQRLIYSGRVLKDHDALSAYNIKDGNTVHLVKGAASNAQRNPATQDSTVPGAGQASNIPSNIAAGTGNDPLAGLTGARYAGFAQMPGADMFGPDGGIGGQNPERVLEMLENPMFQQQMNEAMNNPQMIQMLQNSPMVRNNPMLANMLNNPEFRRMMMDPGFIRQSMQMSRMMGGPGGMGGGSNAMPAPGVTDTTPQDQQSQQNTQAQGQNNSGTQQQPSPFNPFMGMGMGMPPSGGQSNPFAALFGGMNPPQAGQTGNQTTGQTGQNDQQQSTSHEQNRDATSSSNPQQSNPFASMLGGQGGQADPFSTMAQQMMQNPEMMRMAMQNMQSMFGGAPGAGSGGQAGQQPAFNPFALMGGMPQQQQQQPQDTRPPEEQYAEQLRQLNDMGFFNFEQNVRALRMSGGRVEGAIEMLLSGTV